MRCASLGCQCCVPSSYQLFLRVACPSLRSAVCSSFPAVQAGHWQPLPVAAQASHAPSVSAEMPVPRWCGSPPARRDSCAKISPRDHPPRGPIWQSGTFKGAPSGTRRCCYIRPCLSHVPDPPLRPRASGERELLSGSLARLDRTASLSACDLTGVAGRGTAGRWRRSGVPYTAPRVVGAGSLPASVLSSPLLFGISSRRNTCSYSSWSRFHRDPPPRRTLPV